MVLRTAAGPRVTSIAVSRSWRAWVDGARCVLTVDGVFRGVEVPAGEHVIEFRYLPLRP